ncbi:hypothetical protein RRG08_044225 [Elysia crispata]|uniref:Uncharacterized protein n=1 Tax=Elysia crispata TaxID=231223 RepID=A0AAE0XX87_9GAST|nr:hypothetical protein RRG08_044225 [Elysia crispata]
MSVLFEQFFSTLLSSTVEWLAGFRVHHAAKPVTGAGSESSFLHGPWRCYLEAGHPEQNKPSGRESGLEQMVDGVDGVDGEDAVEQAAAVPPARDEPKQMKLLGK